MSRELAQADPVACGASLARALSNLANRLVMVGRRGDAVAPAEEAVAAFRELAGENPAHLPGFYGRSKWECEPEPFQFL